MLNKTNLKKGIKMFGTIRTVAKVVSVGLTVKFTKKTNNLFKKKKNTIKDKVKKILEDK